jgi:hypothetical protein
MLNQIQISRDGKNSGVTVTYDPASMHIELGGWFDGKFSITGDTMSLVEFLHRLSITEEDCQKAFEEINHA